MGLHVFETLDGTLQSRSINNAHTSIEQSFIIQSTFENTPIVNVYS